MTRSKKNFWINPSQRSSSATIQKTFLEIVESLLAGALCDNSRNNFFKVLMKCSKKIFVEWKKTEAFGSRHTPHLITKNILRDQTSARIAVRLGSLDRIELSSKKFLTRFDLSVAMRSLSEKFEIKKTFFKKIKFRNRTRAVKRVEPISGAKRSTPSVSKVSDLKVQVNFF
jgi:hypothetical protein